MLVFILHSVVFFSIGKAGTQNNNDVILDKDTIESYNSIQDSLLIGGTDSTRIIKKDSVVFFIPLKNHGQVFSLLQDSINTISKSDIKSLEYHSFSEMLYELTPCYPLYLGMPGMFNNFSFFGSNDISFSYNNRPLIDNEFANYNPEKLSTEFFENVEMLYGSDAVILSDNTNGVSANIQEIRYNTKRPYTKLWYSQDTKDLISADGIFSQNFAPNFNYTFGFRRLAGNGQYENSVDIWNVRNILRWSPTEKINISLTEYFTNHGTDINGGIDETTTDMNILFTDNAPQINYKFYNLKQRTFSHDITFSSTVILDNDTNSILSGNIFFSHHENTFKLSTNLLNLTHDSSGSQDYQSKYYGGNLSFEQNILDFALLKTGAELYVFDNEKSFLFPEKSETSLSAFALMKMDFFGYLDLSGGFRYRNYNTISNISLGAKAKLNFQKLGLLIFDMSLSEQMPYVLFPQLETEKHFLILSEYAFSSDAFNVRLGAFSRTIANPIDYKFDSLLSASQTDNKTLIGAFTMFMLSPFKNYFLEGAFNSTINLDKSESDYPPLYLRLKTYYRIYAGRSIMNLGLEGSMSTNFSGKKFMPLYRLYVDNDYESGLMFDGFKVFASAKLGETYIQVSFENLLSSGFYYVPVNPVLSRNFRLSFIWTFLD